MHLFTHPNSEFMHIVSLAFMFPQALKSLTPHAFHGLTGVNLALLECMDRSTYKDNKVS